MTSNPQPHTEASAYLAAIVESSDDAIIGKDLNGIITSWNQGAERVFGYSATEAIGRSITMLIPHERLKEEEDIIRQLKSGRRIEHFETVRRAKDGSLLDISITVSPIRDAKGTIIGASKVARDIGQNKRLQTVTACQRKALELSLSGDPLEDILQMLVHAVESNPASEAQAAVLLLNEKGTHLQVGAAPSLSPAFCDQLNRINLKNSTGPSAEAVRSRRAAFVPDLTPPAQSDDSVRMMAVREGFKAGWARPIFSSSGDVLGTFTVYHKQQRGPSAKESETVDTLASTASIVIERHREAHRRQAAEAQLREETETLETLNRLSKILASSLDLESIVQQTTDALTDITEAEFGAFFYNVADEKGESYMLYTLSGVPREAFSKFPMPRNTDLFGHTFGGKGTVLLDDVKKDPRYGKNTPYHGMPKGHLPVTSYLAVPVTSREGEVIGGLFFGHSKAGKFTERAARIAESAASYAAVSIDNARLYQKMSESEQSWRVLTDAMPQLVWVTAGDGTCEYLSSQWAEYTGMRVDKMLGYGWLDALHPDDRQRTRLAWEDAVAGRATYDLDYRIRRQDGAYRWFRVRGLPVRNEQGTAVKWYGTCTDIQELVESRDKAQEANIAKSEFLANMSHEIRTPMNAVFGLANILARSKPLTAQQQEFIRTLQLSADSLLALINDLLDIAKIEARTIELEEVPFSLDRLMQEAISMVSVRAREKNLEFTANDDCIKDRTFLGDATRLRQILMNLCSNAVKFTEQGGVHVSITCHPGSSPQDEEVRIEVSDTGIGIAADKIDTVFQKFVQADNSINRKYGGTGLGLAITKTLTEIMGGTITATSTLGKGSCFTVTLPLRVAENAGGHMGKEHHERPAAPAASTHGRILLVEDYQPNVLVATTVLQQFGYTYDVASNGIEALEKIKNGSYALALMDVQMHGMNGLEATDHIRAWEKQHGKKRLPVIGMTAHALAGDRERCIAAGMDDYIAKPFNPETLQDILEEHLGTIPSALSA